MMTSNIKDMNLGRLWGPPTLVLSRFCSYIRHSCTYLEIFHFLSLSLGYVKILHFPLKPQIPDSAWYLSFSA